MVSLRHFLHVIPLFRVESMDLLTTFGEEEGRSLSHSNSLNVLPHFSLSIDFLVSASNVCLFMDAV